MPLLVAEVAGRWLWSLDDPWLLFIGALLAVGAGYTGLVKGGARAAQAWHTRRIHQR